MVSVVDEKMNWRVKAEEGLMKGEFNDGWGEVTKLPQREKILRTGIWVAVTRAPEPQFQ